jgi:hypothetical protein
MPVKYQVSEKSLQSQKEILALCKDKPMTMQQLSKATGKSVEGLRFYISKLMPRYIKRGEQLDCNNRHVHNYKATGHKFEEEKDRDDDTKSEFLINGEVPAWLTISRSKDNHWTLSENKRIDARIGSTFSTMPF